MGKRFTDTVKWRDPWFRKLPLHYKMFWLFMLDECSPAGIYKPDMEIASFFIGKEIDEKTILHTFNKDKERILVVNSEKWFIAGFIFFQYGMLSEGCKPHKSVINELKKERLYKGYTKGIDTLQEKEQEQDKEKDKDKEQDKPTRKVFKQPTKEELIQYITENKFNVNPDAFIDHYDSNGWKVSKNPMKDWKAAVRKWNRNDFTQQAQTPKATKYNF